ncbi:MAG TPA: LytR family transcriptional regulator [Bacteroidetes bacterium]|nr:LytR family transcriptional regulator [Bacteroidota bacterium]
MARRPTSGNRQTRKKPAARRKAARKQPAQNLRRTLYGVGLWILGIFNTILIGSFVMKHLATGEETKISVPTEVVSPTDVALRLEVLNGCGVSGIAKTFADQLREAGFDPVNVGNYSIFEMPTTVILDRKSKNRLLGLRVAEKLGLPESAVSYQESDSRDVDVSVIIGLDYSKAGFLRNRR